MLLSDPLLTIFFPSVKSMNYFPLFFSFLPVYFIHCFVVENMCLLSTKFISFWTIFLMTLRCVVLKRFFKINFQFNPNVFCNKNMYKVKKIKSNLKHLMHNWMRQNSIHTMKTNKKKKKKTNFNFSFQNKSKFLIWFSMPDPNAL